MASRAKNMHWRYTFIIIIIIIIIITIIIIIILGVWCIVGGNGKMDMVPLAEKFRS